ncbi:hypothetical protein predicted by Glimmer/Critica [Stenotrophomonas maltophilia RA8]|nr:hypothetical protein predicted by Glimmer/Critica [Stenotrophomonas maltophilia RA8]
MPTLVGLSTRGVDAFVDPFIQLRQQAQQRFDARLAIKIAPGRHGHIAARRPLSGCARLMKARQEYLRKPLLERHAIVAAEGRGHRTRWPHLPHYPAQRTQRLLDRSHQGRARVFRTRLAHSIQPAHDAAQ